MYRLTYLLICFLLCSSSIISCGSSRPLNIGAVDDGAPSDAETQESKIERPPFVAPLAPWELWSMDELELELTEGESLFDNPDAYYISRFNAALSSEKKGELNAALRLYRESELAKEGDVSLELTARKLGLLLKLGRSFETLSELSRYSAVKSLQPKELPGILSLLAGYAYKHQKNSDQALAWFSMSLKSEDSTEQFVDSFNMKEKARKEISDILKSIPQDSFSAFIANWKVDPVIGPIVSEELERRDSGGKAVLAFGPNWFSTSTYQRGDVPSGMNEEDVSEFSGGPISVGLLLPLSGKFASHAGRVRKGIELAFRENSLPSSVRLVVRDTRGDPEQAAQSYFDLTQMEQVDVVLGPLLVKTTEAVAEASRTQDIPFISFTKRRGIPSLGPNVFRLGATSDDQVKELVKYATENLALSSFATLYPERASGQEFADVFRREVENRGGNILYQKSYYPGDQEEMISAINALLEGGSSGYSSVVSPTSGINYEYNSAGYPQALFLPDSLEDTVPILEAIQKRAVESEDRKGLALLGQAEWDDPVALRGFGRLLEGATFVTPFNAFSPVGSVGTFVQSYKDVYNIEPELLSAQGYDAASFVLKAVLPSVNPDRGVRDAILFTEPFQGVTGLLTVNDDGEISRRMSVLRLNGGEIAEVMSSGAPVELTVEDENEELEELGEFGESEQGTESSS